MEATISGAKLPASLFKLVAAIQPAVASAMEQPGELVDDSIKTHANMTAVRLFTRNLLLKHAAADERVKVVAALNKLDTGTIELLAR